MKFLSLFLILFTSLNISAQTTNRFQYGLSFGSGYQFLKLKQSDWKANGVDKELKSLIASNGTYLELSLPVQYIFNEKWSVQTMPGMAISLSRLDYVLISNSSINKELELQATLPISAIYTFKSESKLKPAVIFGGCFTRFIEDKSKGSNMFRIAKNDLGIDIGGKINLIKWRQLTIQPQLIYTLGLANFKNNDNLFYNNAIEKLSSNRIVLRILFCG